MTNKQQLQKELLEKVKEGVKPSDLRKSKLSSLQSKGDYLKRPSQKPTKKPLSPPPMAKSDSGYSSDPNQSIPKAPPLPNQDLLNQISSLKKQLQTYKDFKEADLKIKEKYKETIKELQAKNQDLTKTLADLKNQVKTTINEPIERKETKTFTCAECNQAKSQEELSRVFGSFSFCLECSKQARLTANQQKKPPIEEFICHLCSRGKKEVPVKMKLDSTLQEYLICQECKPLAKEFNEADLITDDL
jgi:hypothetical protein